MRQGWPRIAVLVTRQGMEERRAATAGACGEEAGAAAELRNARRDG